MPIWVRQRSHSIQPFPSIGWQPYVSILGRHVLWWCVQCEYKDQAIIGLKKVVTHSQIHRQTRHDMSLSGQVTQTGLTCSYSD